MCSASYTGSGFLVETRLSLGESGQEFENVTLNHELKQEQAISYLESRGPN